MRKQNQIAFFSCGLFFLLLQSCTSFSPPRNVNTDFQARAQIQQDDLVKVSAVVLSDGESKRVFGTQMAKKDIQPVWLEVDNKSDEELLLMHVAIDLDYFSPSEAAWRSRRPLELRSRQKMEFFSDQRMPLLIPPRKKVEGYVFTNHDPGVKAFTVQLIGDLESHQFDFVQLIPGLKSDFGVTLRPEAYFGEELPSLGLDELRGYLENLPAYVLGGDKKTPGDPLNIVIVGSGTHALSMFVRRGWDVTETIDLGSAWRTIMASTFKSAYRTSPVSPLYFFERSQDVALQKTRSTVDERNHLRLWRAPVTYKGTPVWVGQISRDIGVKFTSKTLVTHKIDPDVDEARSYLMQDLISSPSTNKVGFVKGVGRSSRDAPKYNYTRDPYITDGLRVVIFLSDEPTSLDDVEWHDWDWPTTNRRSVKKIRSR